MNSKIELLDIIKDYQTSADLAVRIFQETYNINNVGSEWRQVCSRTGKLPEKGIYRYAFHGSGLQVYFRDKIIDFDFADIPEARHDGFDLWKLSEFIKNQRNKYPEYKDKIKLEMEFSILIEKGIITKIKPHYFTNLYFFTETLNKISY